MIREEAEQVAVAVHRLILLLRAVLKFEWCDISISNWIIRFRKCLISPISLVFKKNPHLVSLSS